MEYPKDRLYLRVILLLRELKDCTSRNGKMYNFDAYFYLRTISNQMSPEFEDCIKTEKHILSPNFLNQKCFRDSDRQEMLVIIRNYKLNKLI